MNYEELTSIQEEFSYCESCQINHSIGQGRVDAIGMIIVPHSVSVSKQFPSVYPTDSKEMKILSMIFTKVGLHIDDWYVTPAVECPKKNSQQDVDASNERLKKILYTISPKVVILLGPQSYYAFFGEFANYSYGSIKCDNYKVFYNYDLTTYIKKKLEDPASCQDMAKTMFTVWTKISDILIQAKADTL